MKVFTVVGIRKAGKTSTVTALLEEIRRRGQTAGSCKTVFCPAFSVDKPNSNTARHLAAGAAPVCASASSETMLIYPRPLPLSALLSAYAGLDYVLLEGDYLSPVPRLVAAHGAEDAFERQNDRTLAFVGHVASHPEIPLPLPRFDALENPGALLDFLDAHIAPLVPSSALDIPLPSVSGMTDDAFCRRGCRHHQKAATATGVQVTVDGAPLSLTQDQAAQVRAWMEASHA